MTTGVPTDLAIQGDGYFALTADPNSPKPTHYTRNGAFHFDVSGTLVDSAGRYVLGFVDHVPNVATTDPFDLNLTKRGLIHAPTSGSLRYSDIMIGPDGSVSGIVHSTAALNGSRQTVAMVMLARDVAASPTFGIATSAGLGQLAVGYLDEAPGTDVAAAAAQQTPSAAFASQVAVHGSGWIVTTDDPTHNSGLGFHRAALLEVNAVGDIAIGGQVVIGSTGTTDTRLNVDGLTDISIDASGTVSGVRGATRVSVGQIALVRPVNGQMHWGVPNADGFGALALGTLTPDPLVAVWDAGGSAGDPSAANAQGPDARPMRAPTAVVMDSSTFTKRGMWRSSFDSAALGGATLVSIGARASITSRRISPARLSLVATTCARCGSLEVFYGKRLVKRISLRTPRTHKQFGFALPKLTRVGTVTIVAKGRSNVDALIADRVPA